MKGMPQSHGDIEMLLSPPNVFSVPLWRTHGRHRTTEPQRRRVCHRVTETLRCFCRTQRPLCVSVALWQVSVPYPTVALCLCGSVASFCSVSDGRSVPLWLCGKFLFRIRRSLCASVALWQVSVPYATPALCLCGSVASFCSVPAPLCVSVPLSQVFCSVRNVCSVPLWLCGEFPSLHGSLPEW